MAMPVIWSHGQAQEYVISEFPAGREPIRPHAIAAAAACRNNAPRGELCVVDNGCHRTVDLDRLRQLRSHPEGRVWQDSPQR